LLAQSVVRDFAGRVRFVVENYGESDLARRFGVTRYPAIFVNDVLVATPKDFGFYGKGEGADGGRYAPWKSAASHERFRADLSRMIDLLLAGKKHAARARAATTESHAVAALPAVTFTDLDGHKVTRAELAGRVTLVEFWATWCPPCRSTLGWLSRLKALHGDRIAVVTVAIESDSSRVRAIAAETRAPLLWTLGTPEIARSFGDVSAVPTLLVFDRQGRAAGAYYGAPPGLHEEAEARLAALLTAR
jgi:thiol-disulfide isomerase/thioredoxin